MASRQFILTDLPEWAWDNESLVIDYVEGTLNIDVKKVTLPAPGRALIVLNDDIRDFSEAACIVSKTPFGSCTVKMIEACAEATTQVEKAWPISKKVGEDPLHRHKLSEQEKPMSSSSNAHGSQTGDHAGMKNSVNHEDPFETTARYDKPERQNDEEEVKEKREAAGKKGHTILDEPVYPEHDVVRRQPINKVKELAKLFAESGILKEKPRQGNTLLKVAPSLFHSHSSEELYRQPSLQTSPDRFSTSVVDEPMHSGHYLIRQQRMQKAQQEMKNVFEANDTLQEKSKFIKHNIDMEEWQAQWLSHCFGHFSACHVIYNPKQKKVFFEGNEDEVKSHEETLQRESIKMKHEKIEISPIVYSLINSERGKTYLDNLESSELNGAKIFCCERSVIVVAREDHIVTAAVDIVKEKLNYKDKRTSKMALPSDKMMMFQIKEELALLVKISWNDKDIYVEGISDDVLMAMKDIEHLLKEYDGDEKRQTLFKRMKSMRGEKLTKCWDLRSEFKKKEDLMLIAKGFHSEEVRKSLDIFQNKNKCLVTVKFPEFESFICKPTSQNMPVKSPWPLKSESQSGVKADILNFDKVKLSLTPTCQIVVKSDGDIIQETSDILVCVLDPNVDLRKTRVGLAFNKACPALSKYLKAEQKDHPSDVVLTIDGPFLGLRCQAICFVILTPWDSITSPAYLDSAINKVFAEAAVLDAKSISFPALGCGKLLQFPPSHVAQIVVSTMKSIVPENLPNKITYLAPDPELFKELKAETSQNFTVLTPNYAMDDNDDDDGDDYGAESSSSEDDDNGDNNEKYFLPESGDWNISITSSRIDLDNMWSKLKEFITQNCLHIEYYNQDTMEYWPRESRKEIFKEAKKLPLRIEMSQHKKTQKPGYSIKGEKTAALKMRGYIHQEFLEVSQCVPQRRLNSQQAPKRGTAEFMKYAATADELFPSYWTLNKSKNFWRTMFTNAIIKPWKILKKSEGDEFLVTVDSKTKAAITMLIHKTFDTEHIGRGADARGLTHSDIGVIDIKRVENPKLFETYRSHRRRLFSQMCLLRRTCPDIKTLPGSKGGVVTTELLDDFMKEELYYEINEHYLFHGTKDSLIPALVGNGIDPRVSSEAAMFGRGIYTAEKFAKSDQYTDPRTQRSPPGTKLTMILSRILLGNVFLCDENHESIASKGSKKLTRPPCMHCQQDKCGCPNQTLYDSVMGDGKWIFREFVVYDRSQCYPEYVINYVRV